MNTKTLTESEAQELFFRKVKKWEYRIPTAKEL